VRHQHARRRDSRRVTSDLEGVAAADAEADPGATVAAADLWQTFRGRLSPDERRLAELRGEGRSWPEVAEAGGRPAGPRRKQLSRAVDRVIAELGLEEEADG